MWYLPVLAVVSFALGAGGLFCLLDGNLVAAAALHLAAAAAGWHAAVRSDHRRLGQHWFQAALSVGVPFFGAASAFFLSEAVKKKKIGRLAEEFAVYLNDAATFRESVPITDGAAPPSEDLVPLADILAHPVSEAEQRIAVEYLASMETPAAIAVLRNVIDADTGEGRFFAMTALGQLEERMLARLQRQEGDIASKRDDGPDALMETARTCIDFTYYQLAQDARRSECLERARELLERVTAMPGHDPEAWILLGRVALFRYDGRRAMDCFDAYLRRNPDSRRGLLWRAEAAYLLGDYARVRDDCRAALARNGAPEAIRNAALFWAGDDGEDGARHPEPAAALLGDAS